MIKTLIVDDDKLSRKGLISIIPWEKYGMKVIGDVSNGERALEFIEKNDVSLLFIDLAMPVMSGMELIEQLKENYSYINYVVLTFHEDFQYIQRALRLGAIDYISKAELESNNYDEIFNRIQKRLKNKKHRKIEYDSMEFDKDKWEKLKKEARQLYWLYDQNEFNHLCKQLSDIEVPINLMEQFLVKMFVLVEINTGIKNNINVNNQNIKENIKSLKEYRKYIYDEIRKKKQTTTLSVCVLKAIIYVNDHLTDNLHQEKVAAYVNMSRSYFSQTFKKITGIKFNEYIKRQRVEISKKLMVETDNSLEKIIQLVGYEDTKYFKHIFFEYEGIKMSQYKKQKSPKS